MSRQTVQRTFLVLACAVLIAACSAHDAPEPPAARLELLEGRVEMTVEQRTSARVPGSGGRLVLSVGDVTGGRVDTALQAPPLASPLKPTPMKRGDQVAFQYGDSDYVLTLLTLNNALVGDDFATFEIVRNNAAGPRPPKQLTEEEKIAGLLRAVETLEHASFIRNGTSYSASEATTHMRWKMKYAGGRIKTAEQFIELLAKKSSQSGQPYLIRFNDGREVTSEKFLRDELRRLENPSLDPTSGPN